MNAVAPDSNPEAADAGGSTTQDVPAPVMSARFLLFPDRGKRPAMISSVPVEHELLRDATTGRPIVSETGRVRTAPAGYGSGHRLRLKKERPGRDGLPDRPPTPWGCEWRDAGDGWTLWRYWNEKDASSGTRIRKERYVGSLTREAWEVLKGYDNQTIISIIGERFRRYGRS